MLHICSVVTCPVMSSGHGELMVDSSFILLYQTVSGYWLPQCNARIMVAAVNVLAITMQAHSIKLHRIVLYPFYRSVY